MALDLTLDLDGEDEVPPEPKEEKLSDEDLSVLSLMEQRFWETGKLPTEQYLVEFFDPLALPPTKRRINKTLNKPRFKSALEKRGMEYKTDNQVLTPKQLILVNMLLTVDDKRTLRQKLEMLEIKMSQYQGWLRDPVFHRYLTTRTEQLFENSDHEAYKALVGSVVAGDVSAMKLFFEMRGIYSPRLDVHVNVESVIYRVVEVVGKYVKDPEVLNAIANEVEAIETGSRAKK